MLRKGSHTFLKCPFLLKDAQDLNAAKTCPANANGAFQLERSHSYYYQVQTQMTVCQVDHCDFVVWAPFLLHVERIGRDVLFCDAIFDTARDFFRKAVLPELFYKYSTRQQHCPQVASQQNAYCFCGGPETGKMVACENKSRAYMWFHFSCVGLKRAPKTKHRHCPRTVQGGKQRELVFPSLCCCMRPAAVAQWLARCAADVNDAGLFF